MIHSGRHLCWTISIPHNIPIWICSHPISMLSIYLSTWRQVCQSHFEFSPYLTKSFNPSGNHRLGHYIFASEYFDLHITSFWNNTFFRRICDLKNTRQWFQTKRKESIFQDCCKTIISVIGLLPQSPSNVPAVFLRLCHGREQMKNQVHISWVGQSTTPSLLQKIGSQGSAANNQAIKCRKLWKLRWATNNFHPLK